MCFPFIDSNVFGWTLCEHLPLSAQVVHGQVSSRSLTIKSLSGLMTFGHFGKPSLAMFNDGLVMPSYRHWPVWSPWCVSEHCHCWLVVGVEPSSQGYLAWLSTWPSLMTDCQRHKQGRVKIGIFLAGSDRDSVSICLHDMSINHIIQRIMAEMRRI